MKVHVSFTLDEHDTINRAQSRARALTGLMRSAVIGNEMEDQPTPEELQEALAVIDECLATIDKTFDAADARRENGGGQ